MRNASTLALVAGLLVALWLHFFDPLASLQNIVADAQFRAQDASPNIVIVGIDDATFERYGRIQEWSRELHANLIEQLNEAGARVIVYDVLFADVTPSPDGELAPGDVALAEAIEEAGNVVLAAAGVGAARSTGEGFVFESMVLPAESFQAGAFLGNANLATDSDGRVRRVPLMVNGADGESYLAISLAAVYLQFGREPPGAIPFEGSSLPLFGRTVPLEDDLTMRVNYAGRSDRFTYLSFDQIAEGEFEPAAVGNNIVLVGLTATAADIQPAPLLGSAHGVEIHANALDTLLRARFLRPVSDAVTLATVVVFVVLAALAVPRFGVLYALAAVAGTGLAYMVLGNLMFNQGRIISFVDPPAALAVATVVALSYRVASERATQRDLQELFGRYVSPQVASTLVERADRGQLQLGGELRDVTVLFGDIRGFTPLSARMEPEDIVKLLNDHFEVIVSRIMENGGIVNKFGGDAVMAFWNAPEDQPGHAALACKAALEAQESLSLLTGGGPAVDWGFGINTGVALAGNVGSGRRQEYTVIGDSVNISARLCGMAPPGEVWIGQRTCELAGPELKVDELPPQRLKGIDKPVPVFRLQRAREL